MWSEESLARPFWQGLRNNGDASLTRQSYSALGRAGRTSAGRAPVKHSVNCIASRGGRGAAPRSGGDLTQPDRLRSSKIVASATPSFQNLSEAKTRGGSRSDSPPAGDPHPQLALGPLLNASSGYLRAIAHPALPACPRIPDPGERSRLANTPRGARRSATSQDGGRTPPCRPCRQACNYGADRRSLNTGKPDEPPSRS
jgi:hypothetical protein